MCKPGRWLAALIVLASGAPALADDPNARGFDPDVARPSLGFDSGFTVDTAKTARAGSWRAELLFDYAHGLLAIQSGDQKKGDLLQDRIAAHLIAGYSLGRLQFGVDLPVYFRQRSNFSLLTSQGVTGPLVDPIASSTVGDLRLVGQLGIVSEEQFPLGLAALVDVRTPTGNKAAFTSDGFSAIPGLVASRRLGSLRLDVQAGYLFRHQGQYLQLVVHEAFAYGAGAMLDLPKVKLFESWQAIADLAGQIPRGDSVSSARYRAPLDLRGGLRAQLTRHLGVEAGAGSGFSQAGYGRVAYEIFAGIRWDQTATEKIPGDRDGDGVPDAEDRCPDVPGPKDLEGCPDTDGDGIPDIDDKCPKEPGPAQNDGCPLGDEPVVEIQTERLSLKDSIKFDTARDSLRPDSFKILNEITQILLSHPELKRMRVEGHTDNVGGANYNKDLSKRRARTVVSYLVAHGIKAERLTSEGYGFERPVAPNATAFGRAKNRRVEFVILSEENAPGGKKGSAAP